MMGVASVEPQKDGPDQHQLLPARLTEEVLSNSPSGSRRTQFLTSKIPRIFLIRLVCPQ